MGLDYGYTCGEIDSYIADAKEAMRNHFYDVLDEACPLLHNIAKTEKSKEYAEALFEDMSNIFESVRACNEDMRKEADSQIDELEEHVSNLEAEVIDLEGDIDTLECEVDELEGQLAEREEHV